MEEKIEQGLIRGSIDIISEEKIQILLEQMIKCICKIEGAKNGTGFFCKITYEDKLIPVLMTNYHIIDPDYYESKKNIIVSTKENRIVININENKILYSSPINEYDLIIIKLNESKNEQNQYLEIDSKIFSDNSEKAFEDESIYILHYPNGGKSSISFGYGFNQINNYEMKHLCNTENCSSGSPILSLSSGKILGIHRGCIRKKDGILSNFGTFLKFPLNELNHNKIYNIISIIDNENNKSSAKNHKNINYKYNALIDFFTETENKLNYDIVKHLLNKIGNFIMNEEELFNSENSIQSFKLLDSIQKALILNKLELENLNKTKYVANILQFKENFLKKIKKKEINYDSIKHIMFNPKVREIFKEKLSILFFNNNEIIDENLMVLKKLFCEIIVFIKFINDINRIFKTFYENQYNNNIDKLEKIKNIIYLETWDKIEKSEIKKEIDDMHNIFSPEEFKMKLALSDSLIFMQLYKVNKLKNIHFKTEEEIFQKTEKDFVQLKTLFINDNWSNEIPEQILNECCKSLKYQKEATLYGELRLLKRIFEIKDFNDLDMERLTKDIEIINLKKEIILTANSCIYFIDEFETEKTDFYDELNKIRKFLSKKNIDVEHIVNAEKSLKKYGINISELKEEEGIYLNIMQSLYENDVSIKLLLKINDENIKNLQIHFSNEKIQDIVNCSKFMNDLSKEKGKINDKMLIENFIKKVSEAKNISQSFLNYSSIAKKVEEILA